MQRKIERMPQRAVKYLSQGVDKQIDSAFRKQLDEIVAKKGIEQVIPLYFGQLAGPEGYVSVDDIFGHVDVVQDCIVVCK